MKCLARKLLRMSKKIRKVSMFCIVGIHDWGLHSKVEDGSCYWQCVRCERIRDGE